MGDYPSRKRPMFSRTKTGYTMMGARIVRVSNFSYSINFPDAWDADAYGDNYEARSRNGDVNYEDVRAKIGEPWASEAQRKVGRSPDLDAPYRKPKTHADYCREQCAADEAAVLSHERGHDFYGWRYTTMQKFADDLVAELKRETGHDFYGWRKSELPYGHWFRAGGISTFNWVRVAPVDRAMTAAEIEEVTFWSRLTRADTGAYSSDGFVAFAKRMKWIFDSPLARPQVETILEATSGRKPQSDDLTHDFYGWNPAGFLYQHEHYHELFLKGVLPRKKQMLNVQLTHGRDNLAAEWREDYR